MDSPFFNSRRNSFPQRRYYEATSQPVERPQAGHFPKVVSIPVRFVDSSEPDRPGSALKIQKVFRGLLVRRSVKKVLAIKREVDEVGRRISSPEAVQMLRSDQRERLRVNETLMNLLLRLDSVRGVDAGVRECRKAVIKRTIALQEKVDAIVAVDATVYQSAILSAEKDGAVDDGSNLNVEPVVALPETEHLQSDAPQASEGAVIGGDRIDDADQAMVESAVISQHNQAVVRLGESAKEVEHNDEGENQYLVMDEREGGEYVEISKSGVHETEVQEDQMDLEIETMEGKENVELKSEFCCNEDEYLEQQWEECATMSHGEDSRTESQTNSSQSFIEGVEENAPHKNNGGAAEEHDQSGSVKEENDCEEEGRSSGRNKELLEKMMEDNEKMMGLMAELFERNREQTRLMATLSQRVDQLERAFVCEKLRRKKKRLAGGRHH